VTPLARPARILLVEDNPADAQLMRIALADVDPDAVLHVVTDGEAAVRELVDAPAGGSTPDLVLLDLNLPRLNGHEVLARMRESHSPEVQRTAVVVLSTSSAPADVERSYALGARSHVTKPLGVDALYETVESLARYWFRTVELPTADN
jgi:CheY-like chemotaxis protein